MGDCGGRGPPQTPIKFIPPAPRGDSRPGRSSQRSSPVKGIRGHNITTLKLYFKLRDAQCPAETSVSPPPQNATKQPCRSNFKYNFGYVKSLRPAPAATVGGVRFPGGVPAGKQPCQGGDHPSPQSRAAHFVGALNNPRQKARKVSPTGATRACDLNFVLRLIPRQAAWPQSACTNTVRQAHRSGTRLQPQCGARGLPAHAAKLRVARPSKTGSPAELASPSLPPVLHGKAAPRAALLVSGRYSARHCGIFAKMRSRRLICPCRLSAPVQVRQKCHRALRAPRVRPFRPLA